MAARDVHRAGIDPALGPRLWATLQAAGLRPLGMIGVQPHFGPTDPDGPAILAGIVRTVLPLIERLGVATAAEVGADTLQQRLADELATTRGRFRSPDPDGCVGHNERTELTRFQAFNGMHNSRRSDP